MIEADMDLVVEKLEPKAENEGCNKPRKAKNFSAARNRFFFPSEMKWDRESQQTPFSKLLLELLDTQVFSGSVQ